MATTPPDRATAAASGRDDLRVEALERLHLARRQKAHIEVLLREGYWFAAPERARSVLSTFKPPIAPPNDDEVLSQSFAMELCDDFPTVIMNTFTPEAEHWAERRAGLLVPDGQKEALTQQASEGDAKIFAAIGGSNFYGECGKGFNPDLALGVVGMWIEPGKRAGSYHCQAVPIRELEFNLGPDGQVDDRFVVRWTKIKHLKKVLPDRTMPKRITDALAKDGGKGDCCVVKGFWKEPWKNGEEAWRYVEMVDEDVIHDSEIRGTGSVALVIGRFGASPEWAWAAGPLRKALPDLRTYDELSKKKIISIDMHLMPPTAYPDDSISHLEGGIEAGMVYPMRPGSQEAIKNLYDPPPPDPAIYEMQGLETRLKRLFFLDWPQQSGDTPPTATQWLDEMTMAQRRIGTPGLIFWQEWCAGVFQRFQHMLEQDGVIKPLQVNGQAISLMPYNPAQRAAEQQDVAQFSRFVQIAGAAFPEEFKMNTDGVETLQKIAEKMGVTEMWVKRPAGQIAAAVANIAKLQGGQAPGAPNVGAGAAAQSAPQQDLAGANAPAGSFMFQSRNSGNSQG